MAVAGASGYAGGELIRLLVAHPLLSVRTLTANSSAGDSLGDRHRHLGSALDLEFRETTPHTLAGHDVVFLALPHGHSAALAAALPAETVVIDLGADFRLRSSADWARWYGGNHAGTWPYGLPELPGHRERIAGAVRIAVPGCYPTAASLGLAPGYAAGLFEPDAVVVAASGTSGAGRASKPQLLGSEVMGAMSAYGVGGTHRHTPEIIQNLTPLAGEPVTVSFTPTLAPMSRGILATCTARVRAGVDAAELRTAYEKAYQDELFVQLLPVGTWPTTAATLGANTVHLQIAHDEAAGRAVVVVALDNLTKGTAGAAVQCANLALGLPEATGLPLAGVAP